MEERVLSFAKALHTVLEHAGTVQPVPGDERASLLEAHGRVLRSELTADRDQPPFPRSTRDGYAVRSEDAAWVSRSGLHVVGAVRAGAPWGGADLADGEAFEIMTGAPVPPGADAVLMLEHARLEGDLLMPQEGKRLQRGENIVAQGAEVRAGGILLPAGRLIGPTEISVAASTGGKHLDVFPRPRVAIVATGDELVELDMEPQPWQIHNSNSYALTALVADEGGMPERMSIARDTVEDLRERIERGREADLLLLSGGVSKGKYDLVEQVLAEFGAEFFFTGALIQPGKPVVFGRLPKSGKSASQQDSESASGGWIYFFGLPGNPVSTQVCFHLFVAPLLQALCGRTEVAPQFVEARLADGVKGGARATRFLPAALGGGWEGVTVRVVAWQGSGDVGANARGDGYVVLPAGNEAHRAGDIVRVLLR